MAGLPAPRPKRKGNFICLSTIDGFCALADYRVSYPVTFSEPAIIRYNALLALKLNVGKMDLRIAAIALEANATVITRNLRDFERVPGLACENWAD